MFTLLNPHSECPVILLCEHAENNIPAEFGDLGLSDISVLGGHHGFDPPMKKITEILAHKINASAILGRNSRLVIDLNRKLEDNDLIPEHYFGYNIPANYALDDIDRAARIACYYAPFHAQVTFQINRLQKMGKTPLIFSLHSFTENPGEAHPARPWDIGLLYNENHEVADFFDAFISKHHPKFKIGHNEPYSLKTLKTTSVITHGEEKNLPYLMIELKNEVFDRGEQTHEEWADIFANILTRFIHEEA